MAKSEVALILSRVAHSLKCYRVKNKLSQRDLAQRLDVSYPTIRRLETSHPQTHIGNAFKLLNDIARVQKESSLLKFFYRNTMFLPENADDSKEEELKSFLVDIPEDELNALIKGLRGLDVQQRRHVVNVAIHACKIQQAPIAKVKNVRRTKRR